MKTDTQYVCSAHRMLPYILNRLEQLCENKQAQDSYEKKLRELYGSQAQNQTRQSSSTAFRAVVKPRSAAKASQAKLREALEASGIAVTGPAAS